MGRLLVNRARNRRERLLQLMNGHIKIIPVLSTTPCKGRIIIAGVTFVCMREPHADRNHGWEDELDTRIAPDGVLASTIIKWWE